VEVRYSYSPELRARGTGTLPRRAQSKHGSNLWRAGSDI